MTKHSATLTCCVENVVIERSQHSPMGTFFTLRLHQGLGDDQRCTLFLFNSWATHKNDHLDRKSVV